MLYSETRINTSIKHRIAVPFELNYVFSTQAIIAL